VRQPRRRTANRTALPEHAAGAGPIPDRFNLSVWKRAIRAAGIEDDRRNGLHVLRHTYASVLLDAGESIKALSLYLGHAEPGFTLRVYTHLPPSSEDRTRRAIDRALGHATDTPHGLETA
jgi:integrase